MSAAAKVCESATRRLNRGFRQPNDPERRYAHACFDTLKIAKTLAEAGFNAKQAEAVAGALRDAVTESTATKSDIEGIGRRFENADERFNDIDKRLDVVDVRAANAKLYRPIGMQFVVLLFVNATIAVPAFALAG